MKKIVAADFLPDTITNTILCRPNRHQLLESRLSDHILRSDKAGVPSSPSCIPFRNLFLDSLEIPCSMSNTFVILRHHGSSARTIAQFYIRSKQSSSLEYIFQRRSFLILPERSSLACFQIDQTLIRLNG